MLTAFCLHPDGNCDTLATVEAVAAAWATEGTTLWVDLEEPAESEVKAVGEVFHLDPDVVEDSIHGEQRPRIDEFDDHIFVMLYGMLGVEETHDFDPRKLAAFCGPRLLITVHREALQTLREVRERCSRRAAQVLSRGVDFILYNIIDGMVDKYELVVETYEKQLDELEDASVEADQDGGLLEKLSALRRNLLELRRIAASQIELVTPMAKGEYDFISDSLERRFSHVRDHLAHVVERIDGLRELLNGVRDNYHTALANRMNSVMKTLTIFAAILLPLSVLAGIYGMNLPLWPPPDSSIAFWGVLGVMVLITGGLLYYFRRRRWL